MTDSALTVWPSANFQPFMVIVTVRLPSEYFGKFPVESFGASSVLFPTPNQ